MKNLLFIILFFAFPFSAFAQEEVSYKEKQPYKNWVKLVPKLTDDFYKTQEAKRIADNVLLYQQTTGGWPKNVYMPAELTPKEREEVISRKGNVNESTIDNDATITEIEYLSKVYQYHKEEKYKEAVLKGIQYLFDAQYDNGGWPQFYPRPKGYYTAITYNDNAMVNVMELLREIYDQKHPYGFIPADVRGKARNAFDKGVDCILKTQVRQDGKLTVWCAQHDPKTLEPVKARAYELPSLSGQESDNIVLLLMSIPNPSKEIIEAVEEAVKWFEKVKIEGIQKEYFTNEEGKRDYRIVSCTDCPPMWARFYELDTNRPFFSDRDGVKVYSLAEIGYERRTGYSWYNNDGEKVFKRYTKWKKEIEK